MSNAWPARLALTTALLLPALRAAAIDPGKTLGQCTVEVWQAKDGLPGGSVRALAQTADGRLWAGTLGGLARYDGRSWSIPEMPNAFRAAAGDLLRLLVTSDGALWWMPSRRNPVRVHQGVARAFGPADGLRGATEVRAWAEGGRQLWMATPEGLFRFANDRFVAQPIRGLEGAVVTALHVAPDGTVWVGTNRGLFSVRGGDLVRESAGGAGPIAILHRDRRGTLWVGAGERLIAVSTGKAYGAADGLPPGPIAALADDGDDNLWIGTPKGLGRLHDGRFTLHGTGDGLPDEDVTSILVDREETLWVGTRRGGIAQFTDRTLTTQPLPGLEGVALESVCEADDGAIWFGTRGRGAVRWTKDGKATSYTTTDGLPGDNVQAVLPGVPGEVWIGTNRGLVRHRKGVIDDPGIWDRFVTGLYRDRTGVLWIAGNGELGRFDGQLKVFRSPDGLPTRQLRAMAEDAQGTLWVSAVGGLVRLEGDRFVAPRLKAANRGGAGATLGGVRSMLAARDGSFWLTTVGQGLARVTGSALRIFDTRSGVEPDRLSQLLEDDAGDLWIGTHNEIVRIGRASLDGVGEGRRSTVDTVSFETTDRGAGVIAERVRQPSAWKARDGRLWFITDQGAVIVDPQRVRMNPVPPVVEIESASLDGRTAAPRKTAHFPAGAGRLVLQYAAVSLLQPSKVRYRHRLQSDGHDRAWVDAGSSRTATYPGLDPGSYLFQVQASNNVGLWNEQAASFAFVLAAPFYRSTWFFGGCGLLGLGLVIAAHRLRVARLRAEYVLLFAERSRMARELHDTLLQGMSAVALQLGGLRAEVRDQALQRDLALMQDTVRRCLEESRQAVWGLRERGQGRAGELGPTVERMVRRLCAAQSIACDVQFEGAPRALPHAIEDELFRISQEAVTNALRHAQATMIRLRLCYHPQAVTLTISDDGCGFDPAAGDGTAGGHFGVAGMRERAARIDAKLEVRSGAGQGTVLEVRVESR